MSADFTIERAIASDEQEVAVMVGELLAEIMNAIGVQAFNFDLAATTTRLQDFLTREKYFVFARVMEVEGRLEEKRARLGLSAQRLRCRRT